ncbi:hypothetical protein KJ742_00595 [Patescibacteria group bacterium]|nr:hypothetical protein [Patescibacteria group bacterium]MBU1682422.1 hypothetical protein [Patescibacteria group bacterium]MBU1935106.1 hypothetical protein [Patescibacteria group bacterium]
MLSKVKTSCQLTNVEFEISELERRVIEKMEINEPKYCPKVRLAMRLGLRNERNLYMRTCDFSGERIISVYKSEHPFPVYKYDYWISDGWTPPHLDYDPDKPFFEQYKELSKITPRVNIFAPYNENCDYCNAAEKNRNCYMHILADRCEDCYYTHGVFGCHDCIDSAYLHDSELCFECVDCRNCYRCRACFLTDNSSNCNFCFDMRGCSDCFMSYGLRNQKYCINNQQLSKEEYEKKMNEINFNSHSVFAYLKDKFVKEILTGKPYKRLINTENSTGNFLINTKNCHHCYDVEDAEDCMYYWVGANGCKDVVHSHAIVDGSQLICGCVSTTESYNCHNVVGCWTCKDCCYGEFLQGCNDCFGCISLRYKKYCILNKEYSEEEYKEIKSDIIKKMGDYYGNPFPFDCATFSYLDSAFKDYDTFTKEEVESMGWRYGEEQEVEAGDYEDVSNIPDDISNLEDSKIETVFLCPISGKPFKIIPQEIRLLKKIKAPLPRAHHEVRYEERVRFRKK